jgi:glycine cleavage system H lipoate-binding protein
MSILFVLVMFLLCISFSYFFGYQKDKAVARPAPGPAKKPAIAQDAGFEMPKGYCFHPGHTWVLDEGRQNARVGLDAFAVNLLGKIDRIEVTPHDRWVRQGQKIWSVTRDGVTVDMVAPVEGMVTSVNPKVLNDPNRIAEDPYGDGWVLTLQAPQLGSCLNNLLRGSMIRAWMQNSMERVGALCAEAGGTALDGGPPIRGALAQADPELRSRMIKEFFLL